VAEDELPKYFAEGWNVQTSLPSGKIIVTKIAMFNLMTSLGFAA